MADFRRKKLRDLTDAQLPRFERIRIAVEPFPLIDTLAADPRAATVAACREWQDKFSASVAEAAEQIATALGTDVE